MAWTEILFGGVLLSVLLFLSLYYAFRQAQALARLRRQPDLPDAERRYYRGQAIRRLVSSGLLLLLAILLAFILVYLEPRGQRLVEQIDAAPAGTPRPHDPQERALVHLYGRALIAFLLILLAVVLLAGYDLWATRRYGLREFRKLQADRRAMVQRQLNRVREEGNGLH